MRFINKIKKLIGNNKCAIFVDMDGVLASYELHKAYNFHLKRPIFNNINILKELSKLNNIELYILSVCGKDSQIDEKNSWLDKYAPFFKYEKRIIISKESNRNLCAKELKGLFLREKIKNLNNYKIISIDDDNETLHFLSKRFKNIIFFQDSSLID